MVYQFALVKPIAFYILIVLVNNDRDGFLKVSEKVHGYFLPSQVAPFRSEWVFPAITVEFFAFNAKLPAMAILASRDFTAAKKSYLQWDST